MAVAVRRPIVVCFCAALILGPWGCASTPSVLSPEVRAKLGTIGVVSGRFTPKVEFRTPAKGALAAAGRGAVATLGGPCIGIGCAANILLMPLGAAVGAAKALPAAKVEEAEAALKKTLAALKIQEGFRQHVPQVARDQTRHSFVLLKDQGLTALGKEVSYRSPASQRIDTILESSATSLGLAGERTVNPPLALVMSVRTRLIRIRDGTEIYDSTFKYRSRTRKFADWAANNAQPFREELKRAYGSLAEGIVDKLFLLPPDPLPGIRPLYPEVRTDEESGEPLFVEVDSLQPTLRWEPFPRPQDLEADKTGRLSRIRDVTYDLKIWRVEKGWQPKLIYRRQGLPQPHHKVEIPLEPSTHKPSFFGYYHWSVRARFELDGQIQATEWGGPLRTFPFKTPAK